MKENDIAPKATFLCREDGELKTVNTDEIFKGRKVILFALPGAFTPTCSTTHLPRYDELAPLLRKEGVDGIYCLSVNDGFVMDAWAKNQGTDNIEFLADGSGEFTEAMGMIVTPPGMGSRSRRYSMLVEDGTIKKMFVEPDKEGDPFEVSDADTMLKFLNPKAEFPPEVTILTKPGCQFCTKAKAKMQELGWHYEEIQLGGQISYSSLRNLSGGRGTAPQIFISQKHIGGLEDFEAYLEKNK